MPVPNVRVEVGFASAPDDPAQQWTDISEHVRLAEGLSWSRGRSNEFDNVEPGRLTCALDNTGGRFAFDYASGPYYPNVKPRKRIRVSTSANGTDWSPRWDGYVDGWPASWVNGVTQQPRVSVGATDRMLRLTKVRALRDPLLEELGDAAPDQIEGARFDTSTFDDAGATFGGSVQWFYGLQEGSGSVTAGDVSGAAGRPTLTLTQTGTGGSTTFGSAGIMPEGTAVAFAPASTGNGLTLGTSRGLNMNLAGDLSVWCQFAWSGSTGVQLVQLGSATTITLAATTTTVTATLVGATTATATKTITTNNNRPHWVLLSITGGTASLYVDQESAATATVPAGMSTAAALTIGGTTSADAHQVAWVGYATSATTATRAADLGSLATGAAERSDLRLARWLGWLGLSSDVNLDTGLSDVAYQATGGAQMLDLVNDLNVVEGGVLFPTGDGTYRAHSRSHRYASTVRATISAEWINGDVQVGVDAQRLINDATASRPSGATARATHAGSVADYGTHSRVAVVYAADDDAVRDVASWWVNRYGTPHPYVPRIVIDLLTMPAADAQPLLALDIGDRIQVTDLPAATTPGGATLDLFVEGAEESVSATSWTLTLATSPADLWAVALFDDAAALFDAAQFAY